MKENLTEYYAKNAYDVSEARLRGLMGWIVKDIARIGEDEDRSVKYKADELLSILGSSLITDFRVEYGRYQALSEIKETIKETKE